MVKQTKTNWKKLRIYIPGLFSIAVVIYIIMNQGNMTCESYAQEFRNKEYYMIIKNKNKYSDDRHIYIEGENCINHKREEFAESGQYNLYEQAKIGDTLKKQKGSTMILLMNKKNRLEFKYICKGKEIL
ncbi:MAG TPA: hypothetical protein VNW06_04905 [Cytophagaceae bacterium]|nr:hypothetical protein [Cytophagaceae bacterium]